MAATANRILRMEDVHISFGDTQALRGLSFDVREGEIFGFLGPSGAGKTTTIKILTRQLNPDMGSVELFGEKINTLKQSVFDRIGVLSDNSGLYERLTVWENLQLFADLNRLPYSAIDTALAQVGLENEKKKLAKNLSRGMKQRLMLVRAVLHKPALLFLDEPTAALDPSTSQQIHKMLRGLNREGTTIFLTTHNMEEADKLCNRVAFLNHGVIVACDAPEALKLQYARDEITALVQDGTVHQFHKTPQELRRLADLLEGNALLTLHSQEPNLEEIFLQLTGRDLA